MKIPDRFKSALAKDHELSGLVQKVVAIIELWIGNRQTVFFPEYTDHSHRHIEEVLLTAEGLIEDASWQLITADDAAVTILAILLHDCALHLSEDGFYSLKSGRYSAVQSKYLYGEKPWNLLWVEFLAEARKFDQQQLVSMFGEGSPIGAIPENKLELTCKHRLLIGEFVRRHHGRLAHEIALSGIPGPNAPLVVGDIPNADLMDLAGFVARSHNLGLREAVDCLEPQKRRIHLKCKVPFVMAVLRISDYLQMHAARAPGELLRIRSLASPASSREWRKHSSVTEIHQAHEDPEAIYIDAAPESVETFLALKRLLGALQAELDQCWAVLGEVYGRFSNLSSLGITIRRVRSNIDNPSEFERLRKPDFIPQDFRFRTASAELMGLLVTPLYGAKPAVGVRELVQNAVDACIERDDLVAKGVASPVDTLLDHVTVIIEQIGEEFLLRVVDHGVGMTPEIVDKYFLNIGASFRNSDRWRQNHEIDGHAAIHRTGRFGVGLLAAFLIGPEIRVTTRHITEPENRAITFVCKQGNSTIEVRYCSFHVGTLIEIPISEEVADSLKKDAKKWDWFCLSHPIVKRLIRCADRIEVLSQGFIVPACKSNIEGTNWHRLDAPGFADVLWSYGALKRWRWPEELVICNGIFVCQSPYELHLPISPKPGSICADVPSLVVYDPDGRFPLNLQRDEYLSDCLTFSKQLTAAVAEYVANSLVEAFRKVSVSLTSETIALSLEPGVPGISRRFSAAPYQTAYMVISKRGFVPVDLDLIREAGISSILIDATNLSNGRGAFRSRTVCDWVDFYCAAPGVSQSKVSRTEFLRAAAGDVRERKYSESLFGTKVIGRRILVRASDLHEVLQPGGVPKSLWSNLTQERELDGWGLWCLGKVPPLTLDLVAAVAEIKAADSFGFAIVYFDRDLPKAASSDSHQESPLATAWKAIVGFPILCRDRS